MSAAKGKAGALERPSKAKSAKAARLEEGEARLVVNLTPRVHKAIKLRALERGLTVRAYIHELLAKDGIQ